jgi:tetratricopeptide (TPR) repeat protein
MNLSTGYIKDINSRAVLINSRAVLLLQQNRHKDAIYWLRRGLRNLASLEQVTCDDAQQQDLRTHPASLKCVDSMDVEGEERPAYSVEIPEVRDTIISVSPDNVFVVFNRAFHLSDYGVLKTSPDSAKASATLLYNMGLAWQQLGAQENNTTALKKALFAYERAYSALSQQCNDSFSYLVMMALCNNMAHIHSHFFNLVEAKRCRDLIPQILACSSPRTSSMAADDYAFFLSETMLLKGQELKFAPAA